MADDSIRQLAQELAARNVSPGDGTYLRRATVTAVAASTATINLGGAIITGVPFYNYALPKVGDVVDVLFDGPAPRIIGTLGAPAAAVPLVPRADRYVTGFNGAQTFAANTTTRLTMPPSQGNTALLSNSIFTVPESGAWQMQLRIRTNDLQTAGSNIGIGINDADSMNEARAVWSAIPTAGGRRLGMVYSTVETLTAGHLWRCVLHSEHALTNAYTHFSAIMLAKI